MLGSTKAEKAQRGFRENGTAELSRQDDQVRRHNVRHNVVKHHPYVRATHGPRRFDINVFLSGQSTRAHNAGCAGDDGNGYGQNEIRMSRGKASITSITRCSQRSVLPPR